MIKAIAIDDEPLALNVIQTFCRDNEDIDLLKTFTQPNEAITYQQENQVDLIFCDIHMPSMTGISLVKSLNKNVMVIFTTAFAEYAAVSYELNAIDYLLKPINPKRFAQAIAKAIEYTDYISQKNKSGDRNIFIRADFSLMKIHVDDILYIEGLADYLKIYIDNRKTIIARMPMKDMIEKLPAGDFVRVHRSYILPFHKIDSVRGSTIYIGDKEFPIGKTYLNDFMSRYSSRE